MASPDWKVPAAVQPKPQHYAFDLDRTLAAVMSLSATVPGDAFTAETLGTERAGNAVLIRADGVLATIGYLVTEASSVWLSSNDGRVTPGHVIGIDGETGFGLIQALGPLEASPLPIGRSASTKVGDAVLVAGAGGRRHSVAGRIAMKQEFAGYWEYVLEEAIYTAPSHPHWGGTALIGQEGQLLGIGSLQLQEERSEGRTENLNMVVPIDLLPPILDDMLRLGRADRPARPWLGLFATEVDGHIAIAGVSGKSPAEAAGLRPGDLVLGVGRQDVGDLAGFFRSIWALGHAGVRVPLRIHREGRNLEVSVVSTDRASLLKRPVLH